SGGQVFWMITGRPRTWTTARGPPGYAHRARRASRCDSARGRPPFRRRESERTSGAPQPPAACRAAARRAANPSGAREAAATGSPAPPSARRCRRGATAPVQRLGDPHTRVLQADPRHAVADASGEHGGDLLIEERELFADQRAAVRSAGVETGPHPRYHEPVVRRRRFENPRLDRVVSPHPNPIDPLHG